MAWMLNFALTVRRMFELMYESRGVGLAANQVDLPLRLFVCNPQADPEAGEELVFINPVLSQPRGLAEADEGCLSFPDLYGPVTRPKKIHVQAYGIDGQEMQLDLDGLMSRIVQHETDHLDGVLFIDRMSETSSLAVREDLEEFEIQYRQRVESGHISAESDIESRLRDWEAQYC